MGIELYVSKLAEAVNTRKSRRKYLDNKLSKEDLEKLSKFIKDIEVPFKHNVEISIHEVPRNTSYVYFKGPDYFAAFKALDSLLDQAKVGFIGELFILYAESIRVGTCWYGHYKKDNVYQIVYGDDKGKSLKTIYCITPLGYVTDKITGITDRITSVIFSSKKKSLEENLHKDSIKEFPDFIEKALSLACKAPSAMNSQCWHFKVDKNNGKYDVEISKPEDYKHFKWAYPEIDVGTAAAHFWIGLKNQNIDCEVQLIEEGSRVIWRFII